MDTLIYVFIFATGVIAALASLAIWAPRRSAVRLSAVLVAALAIPVSYVQFVEFLSKPKPKTFEWFERDVEEAEILGVSLSEGEAIYMWLLFDGTTEPRYYAFPWNLKMAEQLEQDMTNATINNSRIKLKNPFQRRPDGDPLGELNIEIIPPARMPMKPPRIPPRIFNPRGQDV